MNSSNQKTSLFSRKFLMGTSIGAAVVFMIAGVVFWGGFNTAMEATNTLTFCISCHEMEENVYQEYTKTVHYRNGSGVRATCSDCHVPDPWVHKFVRKIKASNELLHKALGTIDTPEKFNERRLYLAKRVWEAMKSTDSRECRNCHDFSTMNPEDQKGRARKQHLNAMKNGNTCIDCHKGIAHSKIHDKLTDEELAEMEKPNPEHKREVSPQWIAFDESGGKVIPSTPPAEEKQEAAPSPAPAATTSTSSGGDIPVDWNKIEPVNIGLLYPGQTSMEWILNGRDHGGARPFNAGDRCYDCHAEETKEMGAKMVSGEKAEPTPIPGKRPGFPVQTKVAHDGTYLYAQFQWPDTEHVAIPFADGGKMDPDNQVKLAVMLGTDDVEYVDRAGCWATCHHDARSMPDEPDASAQASVAQRLDVKNSITKYLKESRTEIEVKGKEGKKRGGWDKLKSDDEIKSELSAGHFMDLLRFNSGGAASEDGHILAERKMQGGQGVEFNGVLSNGTWTVTMKRKLQSGNPGDISITEGNLYNLSIAIHDDYTNARYHHVSLGYKLGLDNDEAELNAVKQ